MTINQKRKGSRGEREFAEWLRANGCESARRTQQYCGTEGTSDITVTELSEWHIEHKATKSAKLQPSKIRDWLAQVERDAASDKLSVIINTANGRDRIAILPERTFKRLLAGTCSLEGASYVHVETFNGNGVDIEGKIQRYINYTKCSQVLLGGLGDVPFGAMGNVTVAGADLYFVAFLAKAWLHFAKSYRLENPISCSSADSPEQTDSVQE